MSHASGPGAARGRQSVSMALMEDVTELQRVWFDMTVVELRQRLQPDQPHMLAVRRAPTVQGRSSGL